MITFTTIPSNNRVPGTYPEFAPALSVANTVQATLIIGQMTSAGTATPNIPVLCNSAAQAVTMAGPGSMLARMVDTYFQTDTSATVYVLPIADDPSATAATATIHLAGTATAPATMAFHIDGDRFAIGVAATDTAATVAGKLVTAISQSVNSFTVTHAAGSGDVVLTALNEGASGNDNGLVLNYYGAAAGESIPAGITVSLTPWSGGTVVPAITTALGNVGDLPIDFVACPYTDTVSLDSVKRFLAQRWAWNYTQFGIAFAAFRGTLNSAVALGSARNDQHVSIMPAYGSPTHPALWAASYCAVSAQSIKADPATPIRNVALNVLAPPIGSRFAFNDRETLLYNGQSTFIVQHDGTVLVEKAITTYQTNAAGTPDDSYLNVERVATLTAVVRSLVFDLKTTFARCVLVGDADLIPSGSNRVNARLVKAHIVANYAALEAQGLVSDVATFAKEIVVENQSKGKLAVYWPATIAQQLDQIGILVAFKAA